MRETLEQAAAELLSAGNPNARRDAELLLLRVIGRDRSFLLAHPELSLNDEQLAEFRRLVERRRRFEPIQYITGEREFYGLRFSVTPNVLIPRPETEHLVEAALARIPLEQAFTIADVGTGSGAIAVSIAVERPLAQLAAVDVSASALKVARDNADAHQVSDRIEFTEADLLDGVAAASFDMVVSNPPYIAEGEREDLDAEVRDYEPAAALFAGPTGLEIYERLIPQAARALRREGWLLLEIGAGQQLQLQRLLKDWNSVGFVPDLQGIPRVALAQKP
jgi:release factor glutamine methyltransferase